MKTHVRENVGTCSTHTHVSLDGDVIAKVRILGGCVGNTQGLCKLAAGAKVDDIIRLLEGIRCQNGTSCPDQLAQALKEAKAKP